MTPCLDCQNPTGRSAKALRCLACASVSRKAKRTARLAARRAGAPPAQSSELRAKQAVAQRVRWDATGRKTDEEHRQTRREYYGARRTQHIANVVRNRRIREFGWAPGAFEQALVDQQGRCAICEKIMRRPCADHDHVTGKSRAALCPGCNIRVGMLEADTPLRRKALEYIEKWRPKCV